MVREQSAKLRFIGSIPIAASIFNRQVNSEENQQRGVLRGKGFPPQAKERFTGEEGVTVSE